MYGESLVSTVKSEMNLYRFCKAVAQWELVTLADASSKSFKDIFKRFKFHQKLRLETRPFEK